MYEQCVFLAELLSRCFLIKQIHSLFYLYFVWRVLIFSFFLFPDRNNECLKFLLSCGADLDAKDQLGRSVASLRQPECYLKSHLSPSLVADLLYITLPLARTASVLSHC